MWRVGQHCFKDLKKTKFVYLKTNQHFTISFPKKTRSENMCVWWSVWEPLKQCFCTGVTQNTHIAAEFIFGVTLDHKISKKLYKTAVSPSFSLFFTLRSAVIFLKMKSAKITKMLRTTALEVLCEILFKLFDTRSFFSEYKYLHWKYKQLPWPLPWL